VSVEYYEVDVDRVAKAARDVLERFEFVEAVVLFGSALRRGFVRDIAIGIVVSRGVGLRELSEVASTLEQALGVPVDLVVLNDAPPLLRFKALTEGLKLVVRDREKLFYMASESFMELEDVREKLRTLGVEELYT